jgi:hypothetical protein
MWQFCDLFEVRAVGGAEMAIKTASNPAAPQNRTAPTPARAFTLTSA